MLKALLVAGALLAGSLPASAQPYPNRPLRIVVPFPPGGGTDIGTRIVAQKLQEAWGQAVIVENKPGAAGIVGTELTAKSAPDGYTFMMGNIGTHAINVSLYKKLAYDPVKDFAPVSMVADLPLLLLVHPSVPANSVKELIALAKSQPGKLNFSSSGAGGSMHVAAELFKSMTGVDMVHIPYKGIGAGFPDLISGRTQLTISSTASMAGLFRSKYLRPLAVTTTQRTPMLPEVPTMAESGLPGFVVTQWHGVLAPAGTPKAVVERVQQGIATVLKAPDVLARLAADGTDAVGSTPAQFTAHMKTERTKWVKAIKDAGITIQ